MMTFFSKSIKTADYKFAEAKVTSSGLLVLSDKKSNPTDIQFEMI